MNLILRQSTKSTPFVHLDSVKGVYIISGRSIPLDAELFYKPILNWLDNLAVKPPSRIDFIFQFDFFNIASSKRILFILYRLDEMRAKGTQVNIQWHYEKSDDDNLEIGQDYQLMVEGLNFDFREIESTRSIQSDMLKFG